jgi:CheY-like chemotaxis protein
MTVETSGRGLRCDTEYLRSPGLDEVSEHEQRLAARMGDDPSVLIIDDEGALRSFFSRDLQQVGCTCYTASSENEALNVLRNTSSITVILLDYSVSGAGLPDFVRKLRDLRPAIRIIGNSGEDRSEEFAIAGVTHFLSKPWRAIDHIEMLRRC